MSDWAGSPARLALQALPAAVIVYDAQHRLVMVNQRMLDLTGADQRWLAPNTPLSDVLVLFMMRGLFGEGDPAAQLAEFTRLDRSKPSHRVLRLTDGTTLEARVQPMADGGFIECFTDVTPFTGPLETTRQDLRRLE
jgi:PAS domain-containing protein